MPIMNEILDALIFCQDDRKYSSKNFIHLSRDELLPLRKIINLQYPWERYRHVRSSWSSFIKPLLRISDAKIKRKARGGPLP